MDSSTIVGWTSPFVNLEVSSLFAAFILFVMEILLANIVDPDQTPYDMASGVGLHCLPMTFYGFPGKNGLINKTFMSEVLELLIVISS